MLESLKELSDRATPGPWGVFDTRGVVEIQFGEQKPVVHWSGFDQAATSLLRQRLNARLIVDLVNAYRSGQLHDATALAEAEARGYARGLEEAAKPKIWVVTNNERGAERRYRMWSGRAWVWTSDPDQAAWFARRADANQILPDGSPRDYTDRIAILTEMSGADV